MKRRKIMALVLAAVMTMSTAMTVCAADGSGGSDSNVSSSTSSKKTTTTTAAEESVAESGVSDSSVAASVDMSRVLAASSAVLVGGRNIQTSVAGAYFVDKLNGVAVITPAAEVAANLNLSSGQTAYIMAFDLDQKKSSLAMGSIQMAADALGADFVAAINVNLLAKQNGKMITLSDGSVNMVVGLPKTAVDPTKTYSVVRVTPGGMLSYYNDLDADPQTVTFEVGAGVGAYAILAK